MNLEKMLADAKRGPDAPRSPGSALGGRWRNRLGSVMELTVEDDHTVHGLFHTGVGVPNPNAAYAVVGFAEGDALSFCVDFGRRGSVAAWAGHHVVDEGGERLVTLWHLAQPVHGDHSEAAVWRSMMAGSDEFTRETAQG